jgi:hypothetical protein
VARGARRTYAFPVSVELLADPGDRAELRAQRIVGARDRRRALLLTAQPALRVSAFVLVVAGSCAVLYGWGRPVNPLLIFACALAVASAAKLTRRATPPRLSQAARAQATVREAWRVLRVDADETRPYPRYAIWAAEADDGTVGLWRITRPPGDAYALTATLLTSLQALDTAAAAEAMADARAAADRDEQAAMAELVSRHAAASDRAVAVERDAAELEALRIEARGLARALRS